MELDLRYQMYNTAQDELQKDSSEVGYNKPHQEVIEYFEKNTTTFDFANLVKEITSINNSADLYLSDGTNIKIGKTNNIINVAILFPNKTKFVGSWSNIVDNAEFIEKMKDVPHS